MLTNLFISLGWSRDDWKWPVTQIVTVASLITSNVLDVPYWFGYLSIPLSPTHLHWVLAAAAGVSWIAGQNRASKLPSARAMESGAVPGSPVAAKLAAVLLACALAVGSLSACASVSLKQQAVQAAQVSEMGLEAAHDAERTLFAAGAIPADQHKQIAAVFVRAFDLEIKVAQGLKLWRAGDPPPSNLAAYQADVTEILAYARTLPIDPRAQNFLTQAQAAVDQAAAVAKIVGVK